ncbi:hypothetical protein [Oceanispirochaeta crateris]|uniref:hypothetical protein n=1 Tax=Oceanispirochaeta crateris TaxID=2518645 RepID=UPI00143CE4CB|nr:hypothetical protein [Oceanispirochaeta crateris]
MIFIGHVSANEVFNARIYVKGDRDTIVFYYDSEKTIQGDDVILSHTYKTPEGEVFARETLILHEGEFSVHETSFPILDEYSKQVRDEEGMTTSFKSNNKEKSKAIKVPENLIFGPTQQDFITENLESLKEGEKLTFSLPVPQFLTTVKFTLKKIENKTLDKPGMITLQMKSNNPFLWFIAKPIHFLINEENSLIQEIHGPTILKIKVNEKWEFFDSEIYFKYL